jgi:hypothetical protein
MMRSFFVLSLVAEKTQKMACAYKKDCDMYHKQKKYQLDSE